MDQFENTDRKQIKEICKMFRRVNDEVFSNNKVIVHDYSGFPQTTEFIAEFVNVRSTRDSENESDSVEDEQLYDDEYEKANQVDDVGENEIVQNKAVVAPVNDYSEDVCTEHVEDSSTTDECEGLFKNVHITSPEDIRKRKIDVKQNRMALYQTSQMRGSQRSYT